ncbi:MAG: DNA methyltransferase [Candidatus Staskawiczbacteria bacterium]|nr:DNA methyltransferase [Candidatus Staskawiczbacteria bacterium]
MPTEKELLGEVKILKEEVKNLKSRKKYGLLWESKKEDVVLRCKEELPVLKEEESLGIKTDKNNLTNILIEGDNYHALSVLNYTHQGKIDVIYADPPYNTGARDWKYNNDYVDKEDAYRHSKWLSFMNNRLKLAKNLLSKNGVLICTIDEN